MSDTDIEVADVYLQPGELFFAQEPTVIRTILGSCVGATFWAAKPGIGALFHAQLPTSPRTASRTSGGRYVDSSIREIAQQFDRNHVLRSEVVVKVFGGADVLFVDEVAARPSVGRLNYETALEVLHDEGFAVSASSLGERFGRKIRFNTGSGEVMLLRLT